jgi:Arc/MetJ-type ribon-helix-helix transcriptional regulator
VRGSGGKGLLRRPYFFSIQKIMVGINKRIQKKSGRGRPKRPGGPDVVVPVRLPKRLLAGVDLAVKQKTVASRSEAIRRMIEIALAVAPAPELARHQELVARALERRGEADEARA